MHLVDRLAHQNFCHDTAYAPDVDGVSVVFLKNHLRSSVNSTNHVRRHASILGPPLVPFLIHVLSLFPPQLFVEMDLESVIIIASSGQPKIAYFNTEILLNKNVRWFEVAMHYACLVDVVDS